MSSWLAKYLTDALKKPLPLHLPLGYNIRCRRSKVLLTKSDIKFQVPMQTRRLLPTLHEMRMASMHCTFSGDANFSIGGCRRLLEIFGSDQCLVIPGSAAIQVAAPRHVPMTGFPCYLPGTTHRSEKAGMLLAVRQVGRYYCNPTWKEKDQALMQSEIANSCVKMVSTRQAKGFGFDI